MENRQKRDSIRCCGIPMHKIIIALAALTVLWVTRPGFTAEIDSGTATSVALNFITHLGKDHTIHSAKPMVQSGQTVGYLVGLNPRGYILVAGDTVRVPIKAYSLVSDFDNLPPAYAQTLLDELQILPVKTALNSRTAGAPEETNQPYWHFLNPATNETLKRVKSYVPDTHLISTQWNQGYPYNKFNPQSGGDFTLTGCTQTALAQVMLYHAHPSSGSGVFHHTWNGQSLTAVMNRPFNWHIMPDRVTGAVEPCQQDEVAALMRDLGIMNQAHFGTTATASSFDEDAFSRAFGYGPVLSMDSGNTDFFATIVNEIDHQRPLLLLLPNHMTVADGYASDPSGRKIHVNLGWGGAYDDYYYLDQTIVAGPYSFPCNHTIYYNIQPCQGEECDPCTPETTGSSPIFTCDLNDRVVDGTTTLRIGAHDPDGDGVTLSASSSCDNLQPFLDGNLLTLTPGAGNIFCQITVSAQSQDGRADKTFKVLKLESMIHTGARYDIGGKFKDDHGIHEYTAYFDGYTTIAGSRGYSNQAFFIWVSDMEGQIAMPASDASVSATLTAGLYTIHTSLKNLFTNAYYEYESDFSEYALTVTSNGAAAGVSHLAEFLGIELNLLEIIVLTEASPDATLGPGSSARVYGSKGANHITLESGATAELFNFPGANTIAIEAESGLFTISRSGAAVHFMGSDGTQLYLPATPLSQSIIFNDRTRSLRIVSGRVMLDDQEIYLTPASILP